MSYLVALLWTVCGLIGIVAVCAAIVGLTALSVAHPFIGIPIDLIVCVPIAATVVWDVNRNESAS